MGEVEDLLKQYDGEKADRANWDNQWQEVHDLNLPFSANFTAERAPGAVHPTIYDTTGTQAIQKSAAVLESLLHPRTQWFHTLQASNADLMREREVALFFEELNRRIFTLRARPQAQFYDQANESDQSLVTYGNQCMALVPSKDRRGLAYRHIHVGAVWVALDEMGRIDTVFYKFKLTAKQAMQKWGPKRAPKCAREAMQANKGWEMEEYLHVVRPRLKTDPNRMGVESMPFESYEISLKDKECIPYEEPLSGRMLEAGGRRTMGYVYSRFTSNPSEKYGRGPAMLVIGDNRVLQRMERSSLLYGEMGVTPPLLAMSNDLMSDGRTNLDLRPAAVNPGWLDAQGEARVKPLLSAFNLQESEILKEGKRKSINDAHFLTIFQILVNTPEMTATEALIRAQEKGALIAPMVGRQQSEWLGPLVENELSLMAQLELMPEIPRVLLEAQGEYKIEYTSSATRMQREEAVQAIRTTFVDVAGIQQVDPLATEVLDAVEAVRFIAEARGVPRHLIRSPRDFDAAIKAQAEARAKQEALAQVPPMAAAAKDLKAAGVRIAR